MVPIDLESQPAEPVSQASKPPRSPKHPPRPPAPKLMQRKASLANLSQIAPVVPTEVAAEAKPEAAQVAPIDAELPDTQAAPARPPAPKLMQRKASLANLSQISPEISLTGSAAVKPGSSAVQPLEFELGDGQPAAAPKPTASLTPPSSSASIAKPPQKTAPKVAPAAPAGQPSQTDFRNVLRKSGAASPAPAPAVAPQSTGPVVAASTPAPVQMDYRAALKKTPSPPTGSAVVPSPAPSPLRPPTKSTPPGTTASIPVSPATGAASPARSASTASPLTPQKPGAKLQPQQQQPSPSKPGRTSIGASPMSGNKALIRDWCAPLLAEPPYSLTISNFSRSWASGEAFCALIHVHDPALFPWSEIASMSQRDRCRRAFDLGATRFSIPKLIDPDDMVEMGDNPDEKTIMTYLGMVYSALRRP
eukprot:TRINITY_DN1277_c0_g1_i10.p1 TRINITY_DN1277_c0_g1~~TRINITY_DN1277_c0_g1_i10.p1  ORF type:complete len:420 (-),score=71.64 TRINITY_DN1277_c0_g1_i10:52-1311(-)